MWMTVPGDSGEDVRSGTQSLVKMNGAVSPTASFRSQSAIISTSSESMAAPLGHVCGVGKALWIRTSIRPSKNSLADSTAAPRARRSERSVWEALIRDCGMFEVRKPVFVSSARLESRRKTRWPRASRRRERPRPMPRPAPVMK
ncbi:hypothetical protein ABW21_db0206462 [Orbilia brochopaga]|nr:hypothetical protein ABW21_db0206462 [Drechslerella brochopaga]